MPWPRAASGAAATTSRAAPACCGFAASCRPVPAPRRRRPRPGSTVAQATAISLPRWRRGAEGETAAPVQAVEPPRPVRLVHTSSSGAALAALAPPLAGLVAASLAVRAIVGSALAPGASAAVLAADPDEAKRAALAKEVAREAARPGAPRTATTLSGSPRPAFSAALLATRASVSVTRAIQAAEFGNTSGAMVELDRALRTHAEARGGVPLPSGAGPAETARLYCLYLQNTELPADFGSLLALRDLLHLKADTAAALEAEVLSAGADFSI